MNSLLLDIAEQLRSNLEVQNAKADYHIIGVKTYYDLEGSLRIAVKVFNKTEEKEQVIILGGDYLGDLTEKDEIEWFEELN